MNKTVYIPAISVGPSLMFLKSNDIFNGKSFRFYNPDSFFNYNSILLSAGHNYKHPKLIDDIGIDLNNSLVFGDSGGYQMAVGQIKNSPEIKEQIFEWLENNSNIAANLDIPPYVSINNFRTGSFEDSLNQSIENFKYFEKNQSGKTKYLNVLHGRGLRDINNWYDGVHHFNFTGGWAIGSSGVNLFYILQAFFFLLEKGELKRYDSKDAIIHIFGCSKIAIIRYLVFLQHLLNKYGYNIRISFDSSYPFKTAAFGNYFVLINKNGMVNMRLSNRQNYKDLNIDVLLPCDCPVCNGVTYRDLLNEKLEFNSLSYNIIACHNLYQVLKYKETIERIIFIDTRETNELFTDAEKSIFKLIETCFSEKDPSVYIERNKTFLINSIKEKEEDNSFSF